MKDRRAGERETERERKGEREREIEREGGRKDVMATRPDTPVIKDKG